MHTLLPSTHATRGAARTLAGQALLALLCAVPCAVLCATLAAPATAQPGPPPGGPPPVRTSARIDYAASMLVMDGHYVPGRSLDAAQLSGKAGASGASGFTLASRAPGRNGLVVHGGGSPYTVSDASIHLAGGGSNDFEGIGAGALVDAGGTLVLKNVRITTSGVLSSATTAREGAVLKVYDSTLVAHGGPLPAGYVPTIGPGMMEPPAPLGIKGTARAHLSTTRSKTYFYHTSIVADGWGALSTDDTGGDVYLEANDCDIEVRNSGYGVYADFGATVVLNRSRLTAATYGGIIAGAGRIAFDDVDASAGASAVMIHSVMGDPQETARLAIKGGKLATREAAVLVKSANADITLDGVSIEPADGVLVRSIVNADPNATRTDGKAVPGIHLVARNAALHGAILHGDTARAMVVELEHARLDGAIRNAVVTLGPGSRWTATADSSVVLGEGSDLAHLDATAGVTISAVAPEGSPLAGEHQLASGGRLVVTAR